MSDAVLEGFDWRAPDYDAVWERRTRYLENLRRRPALLPGVREHFKHHPVDFINAFGCTYDPRNVDVGLPALIPFLLFPKQAEFVPWVVARWRAREDGLVEKSRDMGVTWLCVAIAVWMFLFHGGVSVGFGSRKEEYVDQLGDPKSIFWKVRKFLELLPVEFRPKGYIEKRHAPFMRVINPETGATIIGEAGDNIGRGNRTSIYFKDESAFIERAEAIERALSQTSNCKLDLSTPNGNGNVFYRKRHAGKVPIFTFHWRDDPRKDETWYQRERAKADNPVTVAQELDIDYNASVSNAWISGDLITQAQANGPADVEAVGGWIVGIDAAHFGDDESILHFRKGRLNLEQVRMSKVDGPTLAARVEQECDDLGGPSVITALVIELDGPGVSAYDQLRRGRYGELVQGVHTGARRDDSRNYNLRAWAWRRARDYLVDGPICLAPDPEIKSQLASMLYSYRDGLLLMQSKKEYKKTFGRSPDRADAFVLTFATVEEPIHEPEQPPPGLMGMLHHPQGWLGA